MEIITPNLDKMLAQSTNFLNAYASVSICAPSRAATMSGLTPFETGVHDNFTDLFDVVDPAGLWPAMIRDSGYFATFSGKVFHSKAGPDISALYSETIVDVKTITDTGLLSLTEGGGKWSSSGSDVDFTEHDVASFGIDFLVRAPADQPFLLPS